MNNLMRAAADEPPYRLAADLADEIPHRDLRSGDRRHDSRSALVLIAHHASDHRFDVEGIFANDARSDPFVEEDVDRLLLPLERSLAKSGQSGIGGQPHEKIVAQTGIGEKRFKPRYLHNLLFLGCSAAFKILSLAPAENARRPEGSAPPGWHRP